MTDFGTFEWAMPHRAFVNPSTSDVVATTSAEALAMGKWLICARHPSNAFFEQNFGNALVYDTPEEFSEKLQHAEVCSCLPLSKSSGPHHVSTMSGTHFC
jgi:digalactosyldiacylglycerol synthase